MQLNAITSVISETDRYGLHKGVGTAGALVPTMLKMRGQKYLFTPQ